MKKPIAVGIVAIMIVSTACHDRRAEELELRRREVALLEEAQRAQRAREQAEREAEERRLQAEAERKRLDGLASRYAFQAGRQLMAGLGGGQDLAVTYGAWRFDADQRRFLIPVNVSFNGNIVRANNYQVSGNLHVNENGSRPEFARTSANRNYLDMEDTLAAFVITAAGLLALSEMTSDGGR